MTGIPDDAGMVCEVNESIRLLQHRDGLTFGTDAYLLAAYVRPAPHARGIDLGSGTGIIPLLCLARDKASSFLSVDLQVVFCSILRDNGVANGVFRAACPTLCRPARSAPCRHGRGSRSDNRKSSLPEGRLRGAQPYRRKVFCPARNSRRPQRFLPGRGAVAPVRRALLLCVPFRTADRSSCCTAWCGAGAKAHDLRPRDTLCRAVLSADRSNARCGAFAVCYAAPVSLGAGCRLSAQAGCPHDSIGAVGIYLRTLLVPGRIQVVSQVRARKEHAHAN